jgi:hypothetical protein
MRDLWDTRITQGKGIVTKPNRLATIGIKKLINRAIWAQGLRKKLENGRRDILFKQYTVIENGLKLDAR